MDATTSNPAFGLYAIKPNQESFIPGQDGCRIGSRVVDTPNMKGCECQTCRARHRRSVMGAVSVGYPCDCLFLREGGLGYGKGL